MGRASLSPLSPLPPPGHKDPWTSSRVGLWAVSGEGSRLRGGPQGQALQVAEHLLSSEDLLGNPVRQDPYVQERRDDPLHVRGGQPQAEEHPKEQHSPKGALGICSMALVKMMKTRNSLQQARPLWWAPTWLSGAGANCSFLYPCEQGGKALDLRTCAACLGGGSRNHDQAPATTESESLPLSWTHGCSAVNICSTKTSRQQARRGNQATLPSCVALRQHNVVGKSSLEILCSGRLNSLMRLKMFLPGHRDSLTCVPQEAALASGLGLALLGRHRSVHLSRHWLWSWSP